MAPWCEACIYNARACARARVRSSAEDTNDPRNERQHRDCNLTKIENEFHFVIECTVWRVNNRTVGLTAASKASRYNQTTRSTFFFVSLGELDRSERDPVGASEFFLGFIYNCSSYFTTAKISFTSILYPQFTHMIFIIYTSRLRKVSYRQNTVLINGQQNKHTHTSF